MARQLRIQYPGAWYHITHRGAARQDIYGNDIDRAMFLRQLEETCERYELEVHAYCLMTNHFHLMVRTPKGNLSTAMRHLNSTYSQRFNRAREIDGAVFKGRYAAQVIGEERYLLGVLRYVHLNPNEAGLEADLGTYRWSSLPAYLEVGRQPSWLTMSWVHDRFHDLGAFRAFMRSASPSVAKSYSEDDAGHLVLGSQRFRDQALADAKIKTETRSSVSSSLRKPSVDSVAEAVMAVTGCARSDVFAPKPGVRSIPRLLGLSLTSELTGLNQSDIAFVFGFKNHFGVATALHEMTRLIAQDDRFRELYRRASESAIATDELVDELSTEAGT